jgi:uncharacterized protein
VAERGRHAWYESRRKQETKFGGRPSSWWLVFRFRTLSLVLKLLVHAAGIYQRGYGNALDVVLTRVEFTLPDLPAAFDGYTILHLSDLHFDTISGIQDIVLDLVKESTFDLCVLTGDYSDHHATPIAHTASKLRALCDGISANDGIFAVLGNHDYAALVEPVEAHGVRFLINESHRVSRGADCLTVTGTDDVNAFWTSGANQAMQDSGDGFKIALVHSPELAATALENRYALYLTGHTHGGQVCLPGGRPLSTGLQKNQRLHRGKWLHGDMAGYTTSGIGVSNVPLRFNCQGEAAVITLHAG